MCEWKTLDLALDSPVLQAELRAASLAVDDPWRHLSRAPGITIWRVTVRTLHPISELGTSGTLSKF